MFLVSSLLYSSRWNKAGTHRLPFRTHKCSGEGISSPTLYLPSFLLSIYVFIFIKQEKEALKGIDDCDLPALVILIRDAQLEVCHPLSYSLLSLPLLSFLPVLTFVFLFFNAFQKYTMEKHPDFQLSTVIELPHPEDADFHTGFSQLRNAVECFCVPKHPDGTALAQLVRTGAKALSAMRSRVAKLERRIDIEKETEELMDEYNREVGRWKHSTQNSRKRIE